VIGKIKPTINSSCFFVMENKHKVFVNSITKENHSNKIKVLRIPDRFKYYQKELIAILEEKLEGYF